jgi:hypothetical protein
MASRDEDENGECALEHLWSRTRPICPLNTPEARHIAWQKSL